MKIDRLGMLLMLGMLFMLYSGVSFGKTPLTLSVGEGSKSFIGHLDYLEDASGKLGIEDVIQSNLFVNAGDTVPNFRFTESAYWFRFAFDNRTDLDGLLLELGYPLLDYVSLFAKNSVGDYTETQSGDMLPFSERARKHRTITFKLDQDSGTTQVYYLRVVTSSSMQMPLAVYTPDSFAEKTGVENSVLGFYYGVIIIMIVFNLLLGMNLRDKAYFYYIGFLAFSLMFQVCLNGNAHRYLLGGFPELIHYALPFCVFVGFALAYRFCSLFLHLDDYSVRFQKLFWRIEIICWVLGVLSLVVPYRIIIKAVVVAAILAPVFWFTAGVIALRKGYAPARIYLAAWSMFILGIVVFALKTAGVLPLNLLTEYSIQFGSALEVTLLSLALADKIHVVQKKALDSQRLLVEETAARGEIEKELNQSLSTRLFLIGDMAHRVNNPLNIAYGGVELARNCSENLLDRLRKLFPEPEEQSEDEAAVVRRFDEIMERLDGGLSDARGQLEKASRYIGDLRVIGGVDGGTPDEVLMDDVLGHSIERLRADIGSSVDRIRLSDSLKERRVVGQVAVLSVSVSTWLKHVMLRSGSKGTVSLEGLSETDSNHLWLVLAKDSGAVFEGEVNENVSSQEIVIGLLGKHGSQWDEEKNESGDVTKFCLRLAKNKKAWVDAALS